MNFFNILLIWYIVGSVAKLPIITQVERYGPVPAGKHRKSMERGSSIPVGNFSDFFPESSDQFLFIPAGNGRKSSGKNPKQFPAGILLPFSVDFQSFPAGTGDFPASSLPIPAVSGDRNDRLGY